jgi:hypothetical protein
MSTKHSRKALTTTAGAAELIDQKPRTMEDWRLRSIGPPFIRVGRSIRYRVTDLEAWLDQRTELKGTRTRD